MSFLEALKLNKTTPMKLEGTFWLIDNGSASQITEDKARELTGIVTGIKQDDKLGKLAAIASGEGFDAQTYKVRVADILRNLSVEQAGDEGVAQDPLAAE